MQLILLSFEQQPRMCPCPQGERENEGVSVFVSVHAFVSYKSCFPLLIQAASLNYIPVPAAHLYVPVIVLYINMLHKCV